MLDMWNIFEYFYQLAGRQFAMGAQQFMLMSTVEAAYVSMCDWVGFSVYVCLVCVCCRAHANCMTRHIIAFIPWGPIRKLGFSSADENFSAGMWKMLGEKRQ